jgi:hypothetical protein
MPETDIPRYEIAEHALNKIGELLDEWEGSDWSRTGPAQEVRGIVDIARARLHMAKQQRNYRRRPTWLARVTSSVYGRGFMKPGEFGKDPDPHLCFTVEITDGTKTARGTRVEVQAPDSEMEFLAMQIHNMVELRQRLKAEESGS